MTFVEPISNHTFKTISNPNTALIDFLSYMSKASYGNSVRCDWIPWRIKNKRRKIIRRGLKLIGLGWMPQSDTRNMWKQTAPVCWMPCWRVWQTSTISLIVHQLTFSKVTKNQADYLYVMHLMRQINSTAKSGWRMGPRHFLNTFIMILQKKTP